MCWCLVHLSITRGCWSWKILFFSMGATISLCGVGLIFQMVNLISLCCDVCAVLKHKTGFHRRPRCRSAAQPRAFKHEQIKARGFVPGTMDCCKFNVFLLKCEWCCFFLLFGWSGPAHSPPVLRRMVLFVSSRLLVCVWLASFNTLFGRSIFVFLFFGSILLFWTCSASPTHFCGAAGATSVPQPLFLSAFLKLYYHFYI